MEQPNPFAPPTANVDDIEPVVVHGVAPALWRPGATALWSIFLSPLFGALLQMYNWRALGEPERAKGSQRWVQGYLIFLVVTSVLAVLVPSIETGVLNVINNFSYLAVLLAWYFMSGRVQQNYVYEKYLRDYPHKGWLKPVLLAIAAIFAFGIFMVIVFVVFLGNK